MKATAKEIFRPVQPEFDSIHERLACCTELLKNDEVAAILRITRERFNIGRITGTIPIPFIKLGPRDIRFDPGEVSKYLKSRTARNTVEASLLPGVDVAGTEAGRLSPKTGLSKEEQKLRGLIKR